MKVGPAIALFFVVPLIASPAKLPSKKAIQLPTDNPMAKLKPGPGVKTVQAYCGMCHSTDYIVRQPRKDASAWTAEVTKMRKVFGAPIPQDDEAAIVHYLASAYGRERSGKLPEGKTH